MAEKFEYLHRIADEKLDFLLKSSGAVLIKGPKWCGKSTTAERHMHSAVYMQDRSKQAQNIDLSVNAPQIFLEGEPPKLIDEWQIIPHIWDSIRFEIDRRKTTGQFILTGSQVPSGIEEIQHSGAGRITSMIMRTMSLYESGESSGKMSLKDLFEGMAPEAAVSDLDLRDYAFLICRGGWPDSVTETDRELALQRAKNYYDALVDEDYQRLGKIKRNGLKIKTFLRSYSRHIQTEAQLTTMKSDQALHDGMPLDESTISSYISDMEKLFVIEELPAWNTNSRSRTSMVSTNTRHFTDPSIGCAALKISPEDLINDLRTMGLYFESLAVRDLRTYQDALHGDLFHYRDKRGLEADALIKLDNGSWAPVEVKLRNPRDIEQSAENLMKIKQKQEDLGMNPPAFMMIITATEYAYRRPDGIWIVPLGCLGPRIRTVPHFPGQVMRHSTS